MAALALAVSRRVIGSCTAALQLPAAARKLSNLRWLTACALMAKHVATVAKYSGGAMALRIQLRRK